MQFTDSDALCQHIRSVSGPAVLLSFSCGKDAIAAWTKLVKHFDRVVPFYMYLVPGLAFVEESLTYYEQKLGTPILRVPHPSLARMLRHLVFQPPERALAIERANLPALSYEQVEATVRQRAGLPDAYVACGDRAADSPARLANVRKSGPINQRRRRFMAVFDWTMDDVEAAIRSSCIGLPVDYDLFSRSFDGLDYRFLEPIRRRFPDDYAKILEWFPLADLELRRREWAPSTAAGRAA